MLAGESETQAPNSGKNKGEKVEQRAYSQCYITIALYGNSINTYGEQYNV